MTTLLSPAQPPEATEARPLIMAGAAAAVWAAALGLLAMTVLVLVGWASAADSGSTAADALRTAGQGWLLAHHTRLSVPGGVLGFAPLGLVLVPAAFLFVAGRRTARTHAVRELRDARRLGAALATSYAVLATIAAGAAATTAVHPQLWSAFLSGLVVAGVAGGLGVLRGAGLTAAARALVPARVRGALASALAALGVLVSAGAVLFVMSLVVHWQRSAELFRALDAGPVGGILAALLCVALVPNAVLCAVAYAVGPGFAVGAGTSVSPAGVQLGALPAVPVLAGLPADGPAPAVSLISVLAPVLAGVCAGLVLVRRQRFASPERAAGWAAAAGVLTGCLLAVLIALAGGPAGGGRLSAVGASPWQVGLFTAIEVALVAATVAWEAERRRRSGKGPGGGWPKSILGPLNGVRGRFDQKIRNSRSARTLGALPSPLFRPNWRRRPRWLRLSREPRADDSGKDRSDQGETPSLR